MYIYVYTQIFRWKKVSEVLRYASALSLNRMDSYLSDRGLRAEDLKSISNLFN